MPIWYHRPDHGKYAIYYWELHKDWLTLKFPGADHSEHAWRESIHLPLQFLLDTDH